MNVCWSAKAAGGDLADHFRYGFVTGHRPGNLTERQILITYTAGPTRSRLCISERSGSRLVSIPVQVPNIKNFATVLDLSQFAAVHQFLRQRHVHAGTRQQGTYG